MLFLNLRHSLGFVISPSPQIAFDVWSRFDRILKEFEAIVRECTVNQTATGLALHCPCPVICLGVHGVQYAELLGALKRVCMKNKRCFVGDYGEKLCDVQRSGLSN